MLPMSPDSLPDGFDGGFTIVEMEKTRALTKSTPELLTNFSTQVQPWQRCQQTESEPEVFLL